MVLGQLVAISVAIALFITAMYTHEPTSVRPKAGIVLWFCLLDALLTMIVMPMFASTENFMPALLSIHLAVIVPLLFVPRSGKALLGMSWKILIPILVVLAGAVAMVNTSEVLRVISSGESIAEYLLENAASHPANSSVSFDVVWCVIAFVSWYLLKGSTTSALLKCGVMVAGAIAVLIYHVGVNWLLVGSVLPIFALLAFGILHLALTRLRARNEVHRAAVLGRLGIKEHGIVAGTTTVAPHMAKPRLVVGFWHPYW